MTDRLAMEIFQAADREKLLYTRTPEHRPPPARRWTATTQRALALLVLFDRIIIHDLSHEEGLRIPDLEAEGFVEIVPEDWKPAGSPLECFRNPGTRRGVPPKHLLQSLALVRQHWRLVIDRLLEGRGLDFIDHLAGHLEISRRNAVELFIDYTVTYVQGDAATLKRHRLDRVLHPSLKKRLYAYSDPMSSMNMTLLLASLYAEEITVIEELSASRGLPVATEFYGPKFRVAAAATGQQVDALAATNSFLVLRAAFTEEDRFMPRITTIDQALRLRRDPHLRAVREHLKQFHYGLMRGDKSAITEARREIQKARKRLERRAAYDAALRWLAYLSLPVSVAEPLITTLPILSLSLSIIGAVGAAATHRIEKANEWVLFGS